MESILNLIGEQKYSPIDTELKVHYGLYNSKNAFYTNELCFLFKSAWRRWLQLMRCQWLRCPIAVDMTRWGSLEALPPSAEQIQGEILSLHFVLWVHSKYEKKWIIHKRRGLVSVVNSVGVSPLSVAKVIFSPSVTDRLNPGLSYH